MRYDDDGRELPDKTPLEVPLKFKPTAQDALHQEIRKYLMSQAFAAAANKADVDTEEEANDFDIDDDVELPLSPAEKAYLMAEEVRTAKQDMLDIEGEIKENKRTVNSGRDKGDHNVQSSRVDQHREGSSDAGKERAKAGGERGPAGKRGDGVSEGRNGDRGSREEG